jgi:hypothetical protein
MIIRIRRKTRRTLCRAGLRIPVLFSLIVSAQPGLTAEEPYNWLQLRKLNTENQYKLKQQQRRLDTGSPSSPALSSEPRQPNRVEPTQIHQESKIERPGKDPFFLNQSQQLDQKQLQDRQAREQAILRQRNRTRNDPVTGKRKSNAQLRRSRQQQQNQLNRMRTRSRMNSRR